MLHFFLIGLLLGLSAGCSPGPLFALVISETLKYDWRAGIKVAVAPVVTDLPIVAFVVGIMSQLQRADLVLAVISFCGSAFVAKMGIDNLRFTQLEVIEVEQKNQSFWRALLTNFLSPHPYLFWFSVGLPIMLKAYREAFAYAVVFVASFYLLLVGVKVVLAMVVARSEKLLQGKLFRLVIRLLGALLCLLALLLFVDGIRLVVGRSI